MASSTVPNVVFIVGDNVGRGDIGCDDGPVDERRGALQQSITRCPNSRPCEVFTGYTR